MKSLNLFGEGVRGLLSLNLAEKKRPVGFGVGCKSSKDETVFSVFAIIY